MRERLTTGSIPFRKADLNATMGPIEADDHQIRICDRKDVLEQCVMASPTANPWGSHICTGVARPKRFELLTPRFVVWCSIQLSYGRVYGGLPKECGDLWPNISMALSNARYVGLTSGLGDLQALSNGPWLMAAVIWAIRAEGYSSQRRGPRATECFGNATDSVASKLDVQSLTWVRHAHISPQSLEDLNRLETGVLAFTQHA
jgi:hypothetical protein